MSGSVTSGVGEGSTVGDGSGVDAATGDALVGGREGAEGVWTGAAHAVRIAAARRIATFISRPTLAPGLSWEGSAAGRLWAGVARSMPLRFFRRVRIAKGLTLNLSKRGASFSAGRRGARVTIGRRGSRGTAGVPGSGVSYTSRLGCLLPAALVLVALLTACAPADGGPIAGQAGARSTNAPTSVAPSARSTVAPLSTPALPTGAPTPQLTTVAPVPAAPTPAPAPLPILPPPTPAPPPAPPTLRPPTLAPPPLSLAPLPTFAPPTLAPPALAPNLCGAPTHPSGYNFCAGSFISLPPAGFCTYFACIASFANGRGYVMQCKDGTYSLSGGIQGSCSQHLGNNRALLAP